GEKRLSYLRIQQNLSEQYKNYQNKNVGGKRLMTRPNIQSALYGLWFNHYTTATDEQRSLLVQEFIDEYLQDVSPAAAKAIKAKHPAHYRRGESPAKYRLYPVAEILADFIIRAEDDASGLTASPQTQENRKNAR